MADSDTEFAETLVFIGESLYGFEQLPQLLRSTRLRVLNLHSNHIASLRGLPVLPNLEELNLSSNELSQAIYREIAAQPVLWKLDLSANSISLIGHGFQAGSVTHLSLAFNALESLAGLENFHALEELDIRSNFLRTYRSLSALGQLRSLRKLTLQSKNKSQSNPVCLRSHYLPRVLSLCPDLELLDGERRPLLVHVDEAEDYERLDDEDLEDMKSADVEESFRHLERFGEEKESRREAQPWSEGGPKLSTPSFDKLAARFRERVKAQQSTGAAAGDPSGEDPAALGNEAAAGHGPRVVEVRHAAVQTRGEPPARRVDASVGTGHVARRDVETQASDNEAEVVRRRGRRLGCAVVVETLSRTRLKRPLQWMFHRWARHALRMKVLDAVTAVKAGVAEEVGEAVRKEKEVSARAVRDAAAVASRNATEAEEWKRKYEQASAEGLQDRDGLQAMMETLAAKEKVVMSLQEELQRAQHARDEERKRVSQAEAASRDAEFEVARLKGELGALQMSSRNESNRRTLAVEAELGAARTREMALQELLRKHSADLAASRERQRGLESRIAEASARTRVEVQRFEDELAQQKAAHRNDLERLQASTREKELEHRRVLDEERKASNARHQAAIESAVRAAEVELERCQSAARRKLQKASQIVVQLQDERSDAVERVEGLCESLRERSGELDSCRATLIKLEAEKSLLSARNEDLTKKIQTLEEKVDEVGSALNEMTREDRDVPDQADHLHAVELATKHRELAEELHALRLAKTVREKQIEDLSASLRKEKELRAEAEERCASLEDRVEREREKRYADKDRYKAEIADLENRLQAAAAIEARLKDISHDIYSSSEQLLEEDMDQELSSVDDEAGPAQARTAGQSAPNPRAVRPPLHPRSRGLDGHFDTENTGLDVAAVLREKDKAITHVENELLALKELYEAKLQNLRKEAEAERTRLAEEATSEKEALTKECQALKDSVADLEKEQSASRGVAEELRRMTLRAERAEGAMRRAIQQREQERQQVAMCMQQFTSMMYGWQSPAASAPPESD